jgi:UDP-N-acetylglucosamine acyltransferase
MNFSNSSRIHPTAVIAPDARLAPDVHVGPFAVIDGPVTLGPGCIVRPHAHLTGRVVAGANNDFGTGCVIGERPQHAAYKGEDTAVIIGDGNTFREGVTVHRGMPNATVNTRIGDRNLFMVNAHIGHDCVIGNDVTLVNGCLLGGHCTVGDRALLSGNAGVHQFCRLGRLSMLRGLTVWSMDLPPFFLAHHINCISGVNVVGMRRAGMSSTEIQAVRKSFKIIYLSGLLMRDACARMERELGDHAVVQELLVFIRSSKRGVPGPQQFRTTSDETESSARAA